MFVERPTVTRSWNVDSVRVQDLNLVKTLEKDAAVALLLSRGVRHVWTSEFDVEIAVREGVFRDDVTGPRDDVNDVLFDRPFWCAALSGGPVRQVFSIE